jgi:hypothetical protein
MTRRVIHSILVKGANCRNPVLRVPLGWSPQLVERIAAAACDSQITMSRMNNPQNHSLEKSSPPAGWDDVTIKLR